MEEYVYWFFLGISIVLVGIIIVHKILNARSPVPQVNPNSIKPLTRNPITLLDTFVAAYRDKIRLEEQWRRLDKSLQQGSITQPAFYDEKRELNRELSQVEDKVQILRAQLQDEGEYNRNFLDELEITEIEKSALLISMDELTNRNISEPISKDRLERLQSAYDIKFQRLTTHIEQILADLQESIILEPSRRELKP